MFYVILENHRYSYEIYEIVSLYFSGEKITVCETEDEIPHDCTLIKSSVAEEISKLYTTCSINKVCNGVVEQVESISICSLIDGNIDKIIKRDVKLSVFKLLKKITSIEMPWGILVGIRPTKIINDLKQNNVESKAIYDILKQKYLLTDDKARLVIEVSDNSFKLINTDKKKISIYIGIPFCPTRCIYCSFASYPLNKYNNLVQEYMDTLIIEIEKISTFVQNRFTVDTVYIGGGTPTSLDNDSFKKLLYAVSKNFNIRNINEFTVEAGRPDTINQYKLECMKEHGVGRISINPQSMNEDTLKRIGREHTVDDIVKKFNLARQLGFNNINMDMIIGLPGEELDDIKNTIDKILVLSPENITVHTMAVKRASKLKEKIIDNESIPLADSQTVVRMMDLVYNMLHGNLYIPYYMYRQKMMVGNLENVGYCKTGFECLYNIQMIEEKETIVGIGADAVTKTVFLDENRIERIANKKDIKEYIKTIHKSVEKKIEMLSMLT